MNRLVPQSKDDRLGPEVMVDFDVPPPLELEQRGSHPLLVQVGVLPEHVAQQPTVGDVRYRRRLPSRLDLRLGQDCFPHGLDVRFRNG